LRIIIGREAEKFGGMGDIKFGNRVGINNVNGGGVVKRGERSTGIIADRGGCGRRK
jgi:hypothetical protein